MAKKPKRTKNTSASRGTNWFVIGGIIVVGAIALFGLLYLALREPETQSLAEYCEAADGNCVSIGDANAPVTLVEVSDFGCPHCRDFHRTTASVIIDQFVDQGLVHWVTVPYALGPQTLPAANAALCANEQGQYHEFSEALFLKEPPQEALTRDGFLAVSEEVGLDANSFRQCLEEGRYNQTVSTNQAAAGQARVNSTPTFFINDQLIRGNRPFEEFEQLFNQIINS
jgi:protein-disulfide isomerase